MMLALGLVVGWLAGYVGRVLISRELAWGRLSALPKGSREWLIHAAMGLWSVAVFAWADPLLVPALLVLGVVGLAIGVVDQRIHRIPDRIVLPAYGVAGVALLLPAVAGQWQDYVRAWVGAAVMWAAFFVLAVATKGAVGFGDVKLAGLLGLFAGWFGWPVLVAAVALMWLFAFAWVIPPLLKRNWRTAVPMGPAMICGAAIAVLIPQTAIPL